MYELIYVADAYCGWCYGFSTTARELAAHPEVNLKVTHGALFAGAHRQPIGLYPDIPANNARITELTGAHFGDAYLQLLAEGSFVMDSDAAARGFLALRAVAGEGRAVEALSALQRAFYVEGLSLSEPAAYEFAAGELGVDPEEVRRALGDEELAASAEAEQRAAREAGVDHYPALLLVTGEGPVEVGGPSATAAEVLEQLRSGGAHSPR